MSDKPTPRAPQAARTPGIASPMAATSLIPAIPTRSTPPRRAVSGPIVASIPERVCGERPPAPETRLVTAASFAPSKSLATLSALWRLVRRGCGSHGGARPRLF